MTSECKAFLGTRMGVAVAMALICVLRVPSTNAAEATAQTVVPVTHAGLSVSVIVLGDQCDPVVQRAARLFQRKLIERTGCELPLLSESQWKPDSHKEAGIVFMIGCRDASAAKKQAIPGPEGFRIASAKDERGWRVDVCGSDPLGTLFGLGRLLREMDYTGGAAALKLPLQIAQRPTFAIRGPFLANHLQDVTYKYWTLAQWRDYLEEMALSGCNTVFFLPLQFGQTKEINDALRAASDPPRADFWSHGDNVFTDGTLANRESFWNVRVGVTRLAHELGLKIGIYVGPNDIFMSQFKAHPEIQNDYKLWPTEQAHVCPSTALGRQLILDEREELFRRLPYLDYVWVPSADYGGCGCEKCYPWVRTYIDLTREIAERLRKHHPNAKFCISNQGGPPKPGVDLQKYLSSGQYIGQEQGWLRQQLREDKLPWIDVNIYACSSPNDIAEVYRERSPRIDIIDLTFDITMTGGWGNFGANPVPKAIADQVATQQKFSAGSAYYSEGVQDDLNKFIWTQLLWNPNRSIEDIVAEYARYYFGEGTQSAVVRAAWQMEQRNPAERLAQPGRTADRPTGWDGAAATRQQLQQAAERMPEAARNQWRWKMLVLRANLDRLKVLAQPQAGNATRLSKPQQDEVALLKSECRRLGDELWTQVSYRPSSLGAGLLKD
jgi:hypothetical protein